MQTRDRLFCFAKPSLSVAQVEQRELAERVLGKVFQAAREILFSAFQLVEIIAAFGNAVPSMGDVDVLWIVLNERIQRGTSGGVFFKLNLRQSQIKLPERNLLVLRMVGLKLAKRLFRLEPAFGFVEPSRKVVGVQTGVGLNGTWLQQRRRGQANENSERNQIGRLRWVPSELISLLRLRATS